jgi:hypothetical protein
MFAIFPWLPWLAAIASVTLLVMLCATGELGARARAILPSWWLLAAYCQFFGTSGGMWALGLVLQTILAVNLIIRWKAAG